MSVLPASGRYLSDFASDLHHHLQETGLFSRIKITKTGLAKRALIVICSLADGAKTQQEIADALERVWVEAPISYSGSKNSHKTTMITGEVQMQFALSDGEVSVTGMIEVLGFD